MGSKTVTHGEPSKPRRKVTRRTRIRDRKLPIYTRGEEIFNMVSHIVGGAFGIVATVLCIVIAAKHRNTWGLASGAIYGFSMIMLYTMSSIYHGLIPETPKKIFQVLDHCTIYFLIAGTYTPILLTGLRAKYPVLAWVLFGIVWAGTALGITLTAIDLKKYRVFSMACYMTIGWCIIFAVKPLLTCYSWKFFVWLAVGGVIYTVGTTFLGLGSKGKHPYAHSVFHLFVIAGSVLQFVGIALYCM